jgi:ribosomal protein S18 acetylase RimI-like enzyme
MKGRTDAEAELWRRQQPEESGSMTRSVRRLGPGDEPILSQLATDDAAFDLAERGASRRPLDPEAARRYLANPAVVYWVAFEDTVPVGSLVCLLLPLDAGDGSEVLLYDIGVHHQWRRRGIGRALLTEMERWMQTHGVAEVWVLADNPAAVAFYRACGFAPEDVQPVYMTRRLDGHA